MKILASSFMLFQTSMTLNTPKNYFEEMAVFVHTMKVKEVKCHFGPSYLSLYGQKYIF